MENVTQNLNYRCCFCTRIIESDNVNPCDLNISTNAFTACEEREDIGFYCHVECFKSKLHQECKDYLMIDGLD
jgi:hypothetical protein